MNIAKMVPILVLLLCTTVVSAEQSLVTVAIHDVPALLFTRDYMTTFNPEQPQIVCKGRCEGVPEAILCTNRRGDENGYATWQCSPVTESSNFEFGSIECAFVRDTIVFQSSCWIVISIDPEPEKPEPEKPEPEEPDPEKPEQTVQADPIFVLFCLLIVISAFGICLIHSHSNAESETSEKMIDSKV